MGIFDTITGVFDKNNSMYDPRAPGDLGIAALPPGIRDYLLQSGMGSFANIEPTNQRNYLQRDMANTGWAAGDLAHLDLIGAIQHIIGNQINDAASLENYATGSPDSMVSPDWQPGTPDVQLGPGGQVPTNGKNPYATAANAKESQKNGPSAASNIQSGTLPAQNQFFGYQNTPGGVQAPYAQPSPVPAGAPAGSDGLVGAPVGPNAIDPTVAQFLKETGASLNPTSAPSAAPTAEPAPADTGASAPNSQAMAQMILSGGSYTDSATGQVHDFSQMDDAQKMQLLTALFGGQAPTGATGTEDTGYVGP